MKIEKKKLLELYRCYATSTMFVEGKRKLLLATEGEGPCFMYDAKTFEETKVWDGPGGTMSIIPIPKKDGEFLAVQNFFPTFQSENAIIVWGKFKEGKWVIKELFKLPYLHRFDILEVDGDNYFIGAVLCNSKKDKDDWSDPGKIYVGKLPKDLNEEIKLSVIKEGLTKNHGYCRAKYKGINVGLVTAEEGVFRVTPPNKENSKWNVEKILDRPTSDVATVDIDNDGEEELITIEKFHGNHFRINKKYGNEYKIIYEYEKEMDFGHVVWGGKLRNTNVAIGGYRRCNKELFYVKCIDSENLKFETVTIEEGIGPSNITVINGEEEDIILSANREVGQGVVYFIK